MRKLVVIVFALLATSSARPINHSDVDMAPVAIHPEMAPAFIHPDMASAISHPDVALVDIHPDMASATSHPDVAPVVIHHTVARDNADQLKL